jgi:hypothetical protein
MRMGGHAHQGKLTSMLNTCALDPAAAPRSHRCCRRFHLTAAYHMLKNVTLYHDLGANHFDKRVHGKHVLELVNRLKNLGFAVQITPMAVSSTPSLYLRAP